MEIIQRMTFKTSKKHQNKPLKNKEPKDISEFVVHRFVLRFL
jgi:hypothetical protein